jgi:hypothetical protein
MLGTMMLERALAGCNWKEGLRMQGRGPFHQEEHIHHPLQEEHSRPYLGCRQVAYRQEQHLEGNQCNHHQRVQVER